MSRPENFRVSAETKETIAKLLHHRPMYVHDAVVDTATRDSAMSDDGQDALYESSARNLRRIASTIKDAGTVDESDYWRINEAILRYELHKEWPTDE